MRQRGTVEDDTLDLLTGLVDKSMVSVRSSADPTRYGVLETLRAYGRERLQDNGPTNRVGMRHATYYTELVERAAAGMHGADERAWVVRMRPDFDNLRAAFECAMADGDVDLALRLVMSLPELVNLASATTRPVGRIGARRGRSRPCVFAAAVGFAARGAWIRGDFDRARSIAAAGARAVLLAVATAASPIPAMCSPMSPSTKGDRGRR